MTNVRLLEGDCLASIRALPAESVDACVTDPPYHLTSIVKRFGAANAKPGGYGYDGAFNRASAGFMGKQWDGGDIAFRPETWAEVYRVLKPGAHLVAFGAPRGYHRMACAIEDAGFDIRDSLLDLISADTNATSFLESLSVAQYDSFLKLVEHSSWGGILAWCFGTGFPKSHNQGDGRGTALKPAYESIVLARKPLISTVAENIARYGTGALNIDGCRIHADDAQSRAYTVNKTGEWKQDREFVGETKPGRWPANVLHDGSEEVVSLFPDSKGQLARAKQDDTAKTNSIYGKFARNETKSPEPRGDVGSAARFFYSAKANKKDRAGSAHPTVKPVALMRYLCRLVTPPGGTILDPFAGSGTTGQAALEEGFAAILCEREAEYIADIRRRLNLDPPPAEDKTSAFLRAIGAAA